MHKYFFSKMIAVCSLTVSVNVMTVASNKTNAQAKEESKTLQELQKASTMQKGIHRDKYCGFQFENKKAKNLLDRDTYFYLRYPKSEFKKIERSGYSTWNFSQKEDKFDNHVLTSFLWTNKTYTTKYKVSNCDALLYSALISNQYALKDIVIPNSHYNLLLEENGYLEPRLPDEVLNWEFKEKSSEILEIIEKIVLPVAGYIPKVGSIISATNSVVDLVGLALKKWDSHWIYNVNNIKLVERFLRAIQFTLAGKNHPYRNRSWQNKQNITSKQYQEITNNFTVGLTLEHVIVTDNWYKTITSEYVNIFNLATDAIKIENHVHNLSEKRTFDIEWQVKTGSVCVFEAPIDVCWEYKDIYEYHRQTFDKWQYNFILWSV